MPRRPLLPSTSLLALLALLTALPARAEAPEPGASTRSPLGCRSPASSRAVGTPQRGRLVRGIQLPAHPNIERKNGPHRVWGSAQTIAATLAAADHLSRHVPGAILVVGDISVREGGPLPPHVSHQSGLDIDVGLLHRDQPDLTWFQDATPETLDATGTWRIIEGFVATGWVDLVVVDRTLQPALVRAAIEAGARPWEVRRLFEEGVIHEEGHRDHLHVRLLGRVVACANVAGR